MNRFRFKTPHKSQKFMILIGLLSTIIFFSGCAGLSSDHLHWPKTSRETSAERQLTQLRTEIRTLIDLQPNNPSMKLSVWTHKKTYAIGDEIVFFFRVSEDAYITLFDIGSSGLLRVISPSADKIKLFKGGQVHRIPAIDSPFGIQVAGPWGLERIKAIATHKPWFTHTSDTNTEFSKISIDHQSGRKSLQDALEKLETQPWAEAQTEIEIIEKNKENPSNERTRQVKPKPPEKPIDITGTPGRRLQ